MPSTPTPPDAALFSKMGFRPPPTTLVPEPGFDASTVWVPFTAGGDKLDIPLIAPLEPQHYEQGVKTFNRKIWDLYPSILKLELEGKWEKDKPLLDAKLGSTSPPYDTKKLKAVIPDFERARIDDNLYTLSIIIVAADYKVSGNAFDSVSVWATRKSTLFIDPLSVAVTKARAAKDNVNQKAWKQGKWLLALRGYAKALVDLYPWTATALLFSPEKAFASGLAQVESALWSNLAITCLKLASAEMDFHYCDLAIRTAEAVTHMRYTTHKILSQGYMRLSLARGELYNVPDPLVHLEAGLDLNQALNFTEFKLHGASAAASLHHKQLEKDGKKDVWAHATCYKDHVGCSSIDLHGMAEAQKCRASSAK